MPHIATELARRRAEQRYRRREVLDGPQGVEARIGGETLLTFCSNDYLGLANHPAVAAAFKAGVDRYGVGAGASHLLGGHSAAHHALEEELAAFVGCERTLLFSTGYMANLGVVTALADRFATLFEDKLNHASLIDAARLSQTKARRYLHADTDGLQIMLAGAEGVKLIISDGVFSMDGDVAPLPALITLAEKFDAMLLIDDAHGLGVLGAGGRGTFEHHGIVPRAPAMLMGTLGKAFGSFGAFVAGSEELIEFLIQQARTYIYTTALPPAVAEATRESLRLIQAEPWRREHLMALVARFRTGAAALGLQLLPSDTPIQPLILGESAQALAASQHLRAHGILVPAIRPPTVAAHSARLRITFSAVHTFEQVDRLLEALATLKLSAEDS